MDLTFEDERLAELCNSHKDLQLAYGVEVSNLIRRRLTQLSAAQCLEDMRHAPGRCRELDERDPRGVCVVDLHASTRLIVRPTEAGSAIGEDGALNWTKVTALTVLEIADEHSQPKR